MTIIAVHDKLIVCTSSIRLRQAICCSAQAGFPVTRFNTTIGQAYAGVTVVRFVGIVGAVYVGDTYWPPQWRLETPRPDLKPGWDCFVMLYDTIRGCFKRSPQG